MSALHDRTRRYRKAAEAAAMVREAAALLDPQEVHQGFREAQVVQAPISNPVEEVDPGEVR
jgi:hypothetical protein